jgi:hypothetical protein
VASRASRSASQRLVPEPGGNSSLPMLPERSTIKSTLGVTRVAPRSTAAQVLSVPWTSRGASVRSTSPALPSVLSMQRPTGSQRKPLAQATVAEQSALQVPDSPQWKPAGHASPAEQVAPHAAGGEGTLQTPLRVGPPQSQPIAPSIRGSARNSREVRGALLMVVTSSAQSAGEPSGQQDSKNCAVGRSS